MSIKTMKQRIALVAVTALTAGVLSVTASPVANAAGGAGNVTLYGASSTGVCLVTDSNGDPVTFGATTTLYSTLTAPYTVTTVPGGVVSFQVNQDFWTYTAGGQTTINTTGVLHSTYGLWDTVSQASQTITANSVGSTTITSYLADPFTAANTPSTAVAQGSATVKVVASCAAATFSTTYSGVNVAATYDASPEYIDGDTLTYSAGSKAYVNIVGKNSYNAVLPATTVWAVSATNNAKVKIGTDTTIDDTTTSNGTNSFASTTAAGTNISVRVSAATAGVAGSTVVSVTADGVVVATKSINFLPEATKIVVAKKLIGLVGGEGGFLYQLQAADGTLVPGAATAVSSALGSRVTSVTAIKSATITASDVSPNNNEVINTVAVDTVLGTGTSTLGIGKFGCSSGASSGVGTVTLRHTTPVTEAVIDLVVDLNCAGSGATYTISMDKAAYKIGEIATLTITAKDSTGAAVHDMAATGAGQSVSAGGGTLVKASADTDTFTGGVKTYQVQMTTAGTFNAVANLPFSTTKSATAAYTVSGGDASNADVLKSIVALIASINKQIQALQKLILKR